MKVMDSDIRQQVEEALPGHNARYIEVRVEQTASTHISYRGRELEEVSTNTGLGGCVRALTNGGWGFVSFNTLEGLKEKVATAVHISRLVGNERIDIAPAEPANGVFPPRTLKDPGSIPLSNKKALLDQYVETMLKVPSVSSCFVGYRDAYRSVLFINTEGTNIQQARTDVTLHLGALARKDGDVQQAGISVGSLGDFSVMEGLHKKAEGLAHKAVAMLSAPKITGGEYTVVLDPVLAGVFVHEAFGHLSEADHVYENQQLKEIMKMGKSFGGPHLNVVDGAARPGLRGSYQYDDEGVPASLTHLLKEGVLVGRLHSRETAAKMNEKPTGNARAINTAFPPIVRMTNTYILPGTATFQDIFSDIKLGVYALNWYGGMTSMEQFTFSAGEAYMIRNGRVAELIRPVMLSGNVFSTLNNIDVIANDLDMNQGGGCGKAGQAPLPVSNGSPHIRIQKCLVSGA